MAVAVDRANLLTDQIIRSFRPLRDALLAIGLFYSVKNIFKFACEFNRAVKVFGVSQLRSPYFMQGVYEIFLSYKHSFNIQDLTSKLPRITSDSPYNYQRKKSII